MAVVRTTFVSAAILFAFVKVIAVADEPKQAARSPREVATDIDRLVETRLKQERIPASPLADDAEFLRRVCLDLTGRIPTAERAAAFLDSRDSDKRERLLDELLASSDYGTHFGNVWHDLVVPRTPLPPRTDPEALRAAFTACFRENLPWGEVASRVALCRDATEGQNFATFYRVNGDMGGRPMANAVARSYAKLFLGIRLECAECHDDPVKPWTQQQYWGLAAFFGRASLEGKPEITLVEKTGYKTPKGNDFKLTVNSAGALAIHKEAWHNVGQPIRPCVLGGESRTFSLGEPMLPSFTEWVASPQNPYFARAAVNRFWSHLFGRGLVHPVDDLRGDNLGTHPELLSLLADEFNHSGQDVRFLLRCLCHSRTYQRSSESVRGNDRLDDLLFSRMPLKPLTAEMLLDSLSVAYGRAELFPRIAPPKKNKAASFPFLRQDFIRLFKTNDADGDPADYTHGIAQVLHLLNVPLYGAGSAAIERLGKSAEPEQAIETFYLSTLSRRPTKEELRRKLALVREHATPSAGLNGVLWTLVNQSEFVINH